MRKLLYKTLKWDNEFKEHKKVMDDLVKRNDGAGMNQINIERMLHTYLYPEPVPRIGFPVIHDECSLWYQIAGQYFLWSWYDYELKTDMENSVSHMYLYVLAITKAYELRTSGIEITNNAIRRNFQESKDMNKICFSAIAVNEFPVFEKYADGNGRIITAMFHEDYDKVQYLIQELPDTEEMYKKNKNYMSYYFDDIFLKDLYLSILQQDEEAFNKALINRIRNVRGGYIMPVDVVSLAMIKFARKQGLDYGIDVIEIPKFFLEDDLKIDKEKYKLPNMNNPVVV